MLRLLIVDDEAILLDGLVELFREWGTDAYGMEVYRANSALNALKIMENNKMDIVLTDIRMPVMSGLELFDIIRERYTACKVIFLTGYNDFNYIQEVLRKGGVDYVLKMDGDHEIIRSVEKAIAEIGKEMDVERLLMEAQQSMRQLRPVLVKEYMTNMLLGEHITESELRLRFQELEIELAPDKLLYMAIGNTEESGEPLRPSEKALFSFAIQNISRELFGDQVRFIAFSLQPNKTLWLMQTQSEDNADSSVPRSLQDALESLQHAVKQFLKLRLSVVCSGLFEWKEMGSIYDRLDRLLYLGAGGSEAIAYLDHSTDASLTGNRENDELRSLLKRFVFLESYLENGDEAEFRHALLELMDGVKDGTTPLPLRLEVFGKLSNLFLSHINRREYPDLSIGDKELNKLVRPDVHPSWGSTKAFFNQLTDELFAARKQGQDNRGIEIVDKIHTYIDRHLDGDLSLGRLAKVVYLNPVYLSRLHKQVAGVGLSDVVTTKRIHKAKEILRSSDMKIQDIAAAVGLDSPSYFARLFKRMTQMSPQEYRESNL